MSNIEDPDKLEQKHNISKIINGADAEIRDRFKAIKVLHDQCDLYEEEEQVEVRQLEVLYNELYKEIDEQRAAVIAGTFDIQEEMLE